jgi:hypothetical protein
MANEQKLRSQELLSRFGPEMYREAYRKGMSLSAWLEQQDPSAEYNDGLDAFQRLCKVANIRLTSIPEQGVYASKFEEFDANDQTRALVPEWVARQWRKATLGATRANPALHTADDQTIGSWANPWVDAANYRLAKQIAPAIPLSELVAMTTSIDSDAYRTFYLEDAPAEQRMVRVTQGSEIPRAKLTGADQTIRLYKYGRALEATYETLRRMPIDKVAFHISRLAIQSETDKVAAVIDVLVNGDGNSNGATNYNLTTLDSGASAGTLTLKGWLALKMKFTNPYGATHVLSQEAGALQLLLLSTGSANIPLVSAGFRADFGTFRPINPGLADGLGLGWTADAPANKLVVFDSRFAVERVVEIGANIMEVDKWVSRQTQLLVMTEAEGYAIFDKNATKTLTINA